MVYVIAEDQFELFCLAKCGPGADFRLGLIVMINQKRESNPHAIVVIFKIGEAHACELSNVGKS